MWDKFFTDQGRYVALAPSQNWSPMISPKVAYLRILLTEVKRVQRPAWNLAKLSPLSSPKAEVLSPRPWARLNSWLDQSPPDSYLYAHREIFSSTTPTITGYSPDGNLPNYVSSISEISFHTYPSEDLAVIHGHSPLLHL
ncbi:hypothetical protein Acr_00g0011620 [Actinidia rufa]|uniref:Uncharacterized protein n=1 Tax=Actinidia rufa TaxID=165716 RepID=A0A7J0DAX9_9ERIC|nr:hypothetical protein Acr_00g0011620 [Actinidia rufa]